METLKKLPIEHVGVLVDGQLEFLAALLDSEGGQRRLLLVKMRPSKTEHSVIQCGLGSNEPLGDSAGLPTFLASLTSWQLITTTPRVLLVENMSSEFSVGGQSSQVSRRSPPTLRTKSTSTSSQRANGDHWKLLATSLQGSLTAVRACCLLSYSGGLFWTLWSHGRFKRCRLFAQLQRTDFREGQRWMGT